MYKRILLKMSGEVLQGEDGFGIEKKKVNEIMAQLIEVKEKGVELAIVIGAGNFWRYRDTKDLEINRSKADQLGMLATLFNTNVLTESLKKKGRPAVTYSAIPFPKLAEKFDAEKATADLEDGKIVFLAGGTGNPYFTTDSAASLRALELECEAVFKATKVDGVYDSDPVTNPEAKRFDKLSYQEVIEKNLQVMDQTAISLCRENNLPLLVFNMMEKGNLLKAVEGKGIGTVISKSVN